MRSARRSTPFLSLVLLLVGLAGACGGSTPSGSTTSGGEAQGGPFPIRLERGHRAGERYLLVDEVTRREERTVRVDGVITETVDLTVTVRLAAAVEILALDANGEPARLRYRVESCERTTGGTRGTLLRQGQIVEVETGATRETARVTIDGAAPTAELLAALDPVLTSTRSTRNDDQLFGSERPRTVGAVWQPYFAAIAADLGRASPFRLDPSRMSGTVTLVEHRREGPVDGLVVDTHVDAHDARLEGLPEGTTVRRGDFELEQEGFFPLDATMPVLRERTSLVLGLQMDLPGSRGRGNTEMTMRIAMTGEKRIEPVR